MAYVNYKEYIQSDKWVKTRCDAILYAEGKCESCGSDKNLQVHHINYDNLGFEEPDDLIVLCGRCHMKEHDLIPIKKKKRIRTKAGKDSLLYLRKVLMTKFSIKLKGCHGWKGLAKKTAQLHGEKFFGSRSSAKTYVKKKLYG